MICRSLVALVWRIHKVSQNGRIKNAIKIWQTMINFAFSIILIDVAVQKAVAHCGTVLTPCCEADNDPHTGKSQDIPLSAESRKQGVMISVDSKTCGSHVVSISVDDMTVVEHVPDTWLKLRLNISGLVRTQMMVKIK